MKGLGTSHCFTRRPRLRHQPLWAMGMVSGAYLLSTSSGKVNHPCLHMNVLELNVKELRPPHMDDSGRTKYPVLFRVWVIKGPTRPQSTPDLIFFWLFYLYRWFFYDPWQRIFRYGGPASQLVDLTFQRDWHHYVACGLQYIVVIVDGRGTGFKGRKLRNPVKGNLGFFETVDQIAAAKWVSLYFLSLVSFSPFGKFMVRSVLGFGLENL